jgi:hypothetical protein
MEAVETLRFTGFDVLEQADDRVWRGEGAPGEKQNCGVAARKGAN